MNTKDAMVLMARLAAAFPATAATEHTMAIYLERMIPFPFEYARPRIERLIDTHPYPTLPPVAAVVEAIVGANPDALTLYQRARAESKPLVRDAASPTGWAVGTAVYPPEALPPRRPSLPSGPLIGEEQRQGLLARLREFAGALRSGGASDAGDWS